MAKFTAVAGLDQIVALMVADDVREIADKVRDVAKTLAPEVKNWEHRGDHRVRPTHRAVPKEAVNHNVPDNLRFRVNTITREMNEFRWGDWDWDANDPESNHVHPLNTWMLHPEDHSSGAVANILNCRCSAIYDKNAIRKTIRTERTEILGALVRVKVSARGNRIIASEFGEPYDAPAPPAVGLHWMGRAAAIAAAG